MLKYTNCLNWPKQAVHVLRYDCILSCKPFEILLVNRQHKDTQDLPLKTSKGRDATYVGLGFRVYSPLLERQSCLESPILE